MFLLSWWNSILPKLHVIGPPSLNKVGLHANLYWLLFLFLFLVAGCIDACLHLALNSESDCSQGFQEVQWNGSSLSVNGKAMISIFVVGHLVSGNQSRQVQDGILPYIPGCSAGGTMTSRLLCLTFCSNDGQKQLAIPSGLIVYSFMLSWVHAVNEIYVLHAHDWPLIGHVHIPDMGTGIAMLPETLPLFWRGWCPTLGISCFWSHSQLAMVCLWTCMRMQWCLN